MLTLKLGTSVQGEEQKWKKICWDISRAWIIKDPGVQGETIHYLDSKDPLTSVKSQSTITLFVFLEVNSGGSIQGKGNYYSVSLRI